MRKKILFLSMLSLLAFQGVTSCASDDSFENYTSTNSIATITIQGSNIKTYTSVDVEVVELNTGTKIAKQIANTSILALELPKGSYRISLSGNAINEQNENIEISGNQNIDITDNVINLSIPVYIKQFNKDFVIEEVFFAGVKTPEGKNYNSGRYFKIVNNTDEVLYADQLIIAQSEFLTQVKNDVTPYNKEEYFPTKGVMVLPGTGKDYPVVPGDFIVVADNAINHKEKTLTAFDLSNADFEFPNNNQALGNVDNPDVPNATVVYTQMSFNMFFMHSGGVEAYVLARFPEGQNTTTFLGSQSYSYSYTNSAGNTTNKTTMKIPNSWIVDGMNGGVEPSLHVLTANSIDASWVTISTVLNAPERLGKSVRRKILGSTPSGKNRYKDTNNSKEDFVLGAPSLENGIQH